MGSNRYIEAAFQRFVQQHRPEEFESMRNWLGWLGPDHVQRVKAIDTLFEQRNQTVWANCFADMSTTGQRPPGFVGSLIAEAELTTRRCASFTVSRSLASMDFRERTFLRLAELLNSAYDGNVEIYRLWRTALIWGDGKGTVGDWHSFGLDESEKMSPVPATMRIWNLSVDQVANALRQHVGQFLDRNDLPADFRAMLQEFADQVSPAGDGSWLEASTGASVAVCAKR